MIIFWVFLLTIEFIKSSIGKMEKVESETEMYTDYEDQFQWFLAMALIFFTLDIILPNRKTLWLRKIKLFVHSCSFYIKLICN